MSRYADIHGISLTRLPGVFRLEVIVTIPVNVSILLWVAQTVHARGASTGHDCHFQKSLWRKKKFSPLPVQSHSSPSFINCSLALPDQDKPTTRTQLTSCPGDVHGVDLASYPGSFLGRNRNRLQLRCSTPKQAAARKMSLGLGFDRQRYVGLLSKLIGETEHLQNNPPKFVPQEDR